MQGKHIAVWFSCGAASAVAAKLTLEKYGKENPMKNYDVDCGLFCEEGAWKEKK